MYRGTPEQQLNFRKPENLMEIKQYVRHKAFLGFKKKQEADMPLTTFTSLFIVIMKMKELPNLCCILVC